MKRVLFAAALSFACFGVSGPAAGQDTTEDDGFDAVEGFFGAAPDEPASASEEAASVEPGAAATEGDAASPHAEETPDEEADSSAAPSVIENLLDAFGTARSLLGMDDTESAEPDVAVEVEDLFAPETSAEEEPAARASRREGDRIEPIQGFDDARQMALLEERPLLVVLGAEWCTWCRKLEAELSTEHADEILRQWVVAEVDVDEEPVVAEKFAARGLPALRIVDTAAETVAEQTGYMPLDELQRWLDEHLEQADPTLQRVLLESGRPTQQEVSELAELLTRRSAALRAAASRRLTAHRSVAAAQVVDLLRTGPLAGQLSALDILEAWDAPTGGLDPWDPATLNESTLQPLLAWVRKVPADAAGQQSGRVATMDAEEARRVVREMVSASPLRRSELAAQAIALGQPVAVEVRRLLEVGDDTFSDQQREWLRMVNYGVLAGNAMRLENAGLLRALAKLDAQTHRTAAERLLQTATSQDQPLIDALAKDEDPLVRELAVMALGRIGALAEGDRLQRLLADESPSVRTAVLRELAEDPTAEVTGRLVEYLKTEPDEDLLVYATKTLGQLHEDAQAAAALADLMGDSRWRVRAAALDAVQQFLGEQTQYTFLSDQQPAVGEPIADAVIARLEDEDAFVREKAVGVLPRILSEDTAGRIAKFFLDDMNRLDRALESVESYEKEQQFQPLIELSRQWLEGPDDARVVDAALLLTKISPTHMRYQLDELLQSDQRQVRIAALQAVLPTVSKFREEEIASEVEIWRVRAGIDAKRALDALPLIRAVPDSFAPYQPAKDAEVEEQAEEDSREAGSAAPATEATAIDVAANFFGAGPAAEVFDRDEDSAATEPQQPASEDNGAAELDATAEEDVLDLAASLFGEASSELEGSTGDDPAAVDAEGPRLNVERLGLGSYWMERWRHHNSTIERPTWIRNIQPLVAELAHSQHAREQAWARAAHVVLGNTEWTEELIHTVQRQEAVEELPSIEAIVSWLPPEQVLALIRDNQQSAESPDLQAAELATAATVLDNQQLADYFISTISAEETSRPERLSLVSAQLVRSFTGAAGHEHLQLLSSEDVASDKTEALSRLKAGKLVPGQLEAAQWTIERYHEAETGEARSVLLTAMATASRRHGIAEALAILERATEENLLVRVAARLALTDLTSLAADRAVVLLDHSVPTVATEALRRLGTVNYQFATSKDVLETPHVWAEKAGLLGLQSTDRPIPVEPLRRIQTSTEGETAGIASALLLSLGEQADVSEVSRQLTGMEDSLVLLTVALARAGRTDDEAMAIYNRCVDTADYSNRHAVRLALSKLRSEKIDRLLQRLPDSSGFAF